MKADFDIDTVAACDAGAEIELLHPTTGQPTGMFITVVGKDSSVFQGLVSKAADAERRRQFAAQKRGKVAEPKLYADTQREGIEMLAASTTAFRTEIADASTAGGKLSKAVLILDGAELAFSEDNAIKFYTKRPAFKTQIDEAIANLENFIVS